jgi:ketosteroid isomerase-like protein
MFRSTAAALAALALALCLAVPAGATATPTDEVVAAERAFAADALVRGVGPSFVTWAAPDGVVLRPDPVNAREVYSKRPASKPEDPALKWWPAHAGAARSGDLAFDTGPWVYGDDKAHGWFLTIWKRQPDGSWRWVLDHGLDSPPSKLGADGQVSRLRPVATGPLDPARALEQVKAEEAALSRETAAGSLAAAYRKRLGEGAWIAGLEPDPQTSKADVLAALPRRPQTMAMALLGGAASKAGDFAYTFGKASWTADGKLVEARYVRVWRKERGAWRIVFDEITPN